MNPIPKLLTITVAITCCAGCTITLAPPQASASYQAEDAGPQVDIVAEADVSPVAVDEYYFVGGRYYYWHPGAGRYVLLRGRPPEGHRILRSNRLASRDRMGRPMNPGMDRSRGNAGKPNGNPQSQKKAQPGPQQRQKKEPDKKNQ